MAPFEAKNSMPHDDSRQCEHLLSQEICPSFSDLSHSISLESPINLKKSPAITQMQVAKLGNWGSKCSIWPKIDDFGCF